MSIPNVSGADIQDVKLRDLHWGCGVRINEVITQRNAIDDNRHCRRFIVGDNTSTIESLVAVS
jgi:hypothetical protein